MRQTKVICDRCGEEPKDKFMPIMVGQDPQQPVDLCLPCSDAFKTFMQNGRQSSQDAPQCVDGAIKGTHSEGQLE
jgi:hypothetical protein